MVGRAGDEGITVTFKEGNVIDTLKGSKLSYRNKHFKRVPLGKQVVTVRVHWLPHYLSDNVVKTLLVDYGTSLSIERLSSTVAGFKVFNGVREVKMEVDEWQKVALPHLINL